MKYKILILSLAIFLSCLFQTTTSYAKTRLKNIRHWTAPDHTRIVFDVDKLPKYRLSPDGNTQHLIVELHDTSALLRYRKFKIGDGLINTIRIKSKDKNVLGIIIDLRMPAKLDVFTLKKYNNKPERLVIDVIRPIQKAIRQREEKSLTKARKLGKRIVLIDPGHGGEDPGAIGYRIKLEEKKVALNIAKRLQYLLKRNFGITSYLSRTGDYYLSLNKRTKLAEKYKADLMISIHANSNTSSKVRGFSLYYLSPKGASDKASELLAQKENAADLIGGTSLSEDKTLHAILIDMLQTSSVNDSIKLGKTTLNRMKDLTKIPIDKKLHSAPFAVLKSPATPSILVEMAYLSNPKEERLLADPKFQRQMAQKLAQSIQDYFKQTTEDKEPRTAKKSDESTIKSNIIHIVKKGETIWRIAQIYKVSLKELRKINGMGRSNIIKVGQKLHIP